MIGLKFGGATLANPELIERSADIVAECYTNNQRPIVVVSAIKGDISVTKYLRGIVEDRLYHGKYDTDVYGLVSTFVSRLREPHNDIASKLGIKVDLEDDFMGLESALRKVREYSLEAEDSVIVYGERFSSKIFSELLRRKGIPSGQYNASDVGMLTDDDFGNANPLPEAYPLLGKNLAWDGEVKVVTGFEGITKDGRYTTLGPNSSDFSISIISAGIDEYSPERVDEIIIFKNTIMMTADPKIVGEEKVKPIHQISYREVAEAGDYASRVIHPQAIDPARRRRIPIRVKDFNKAQEDGTLIREESVTSPYVVKIISNQEREHMFTIEIFEGRDRYGVLRDLCDVFAEHQTSVNMIASSKIRVTATTNDEQQNNNLEGIAKALARKYGDVKSERSSYVTVIGEGMQDVPGIAHRVTEALAKEGINIEMITQPKGELTTVYFVAPEDNHTAVKAIHREFFEG